MVNALAGLADGARLSQGFQDTYDTSRLNMLAGKAYTAPQEQRQSLLGQMAAVNPQAAQAQQQQWQGDEDRQTKLLVNGARYMKGALDSKNPSAVAGAWKSVRPALIRAGLATEQELSPEWDPSYEQTVHQLLAMGGPDVNGATPTDVRSFQMMTAGLTPEDQMRARRINLGLDGRASSSGFSQVKLTGADGRERIGVLNGKTGQIDLPDGTSFNPQTGAISATVGAPQGAPAAGMYDTQNGRVAIGEGLTPAQWQAVQADVANSGGSDSYQLPPQSVQRPAAGGAFVGRSPEEQAALTEQAKANVELANLPAKLNMQTEADITRSRGVEQAKSEQERASNERAKTAQLNNVDRGLTRIDEAMKKLTGSLIDTGPIDGRLMVSTPQGQELEAAVGAIQNDMLALTRVPGIGSQSDLEAKIANLKYPSIYNHPSVNAANFKQLRDFMGDLRRQITGQATTTPSAGQAAPAASDFSNLWN